MLSFGNKEFRNLQEQVLKNANDINKIEMINSVLSEFGINVRGVVDAADDLPEAGSYTLEDTGTAYLVGSTTPRRMYILTGIQGQDGITLGWVDIGVFPAKGEQGEPGRDGITPVIYIDDDGYWIINGTDTGVKAKGSKGSQGNPGLTPYIGSNGNWFIGTEDTLVPARGTQGAPGINTFFNLLGKRTSTPVGSIDPDSLSVGSGYLVGSEAPYDFYVVYPDNGSNAWVNLGALTVEGYDIVSLNSYNLEEGAVLSPQDYIRLVSNPYAEILYKGARYRFSENTYGQIDGGEQHRGTYMIYSMVSQEVDDPANENIVNRIIRIANGEQGTVSLLAKLSVENIVNTTELETAISGLSSVYEAKNDVLSALSGLSISGTGLIGIASSSAYFDTQNYITASDAVFSNYATVSTVDTLTSSVDALASNLSTNYYVKTEVYNKTETDNLIAPLVSSVSALTSTVSAIPSTYATISTTDTLSSAINTVSTNLSNNYYTKSQTNSAIASAIASVSVDLTDYYTKSQTDSAIASAVASVSVDLTNYYTKSETNSVVASSLSGYATTSALNSAVSGLESSIASVSAAFSAYYTKSETDTAIASAVASVSVDLTSYYTSSQTDSAISAALSGYATTSSVNNSLSSINSAITTLENNQSNFILHYSNYEDEYYLRRQYINQYVDEEENVLYISLDESDKTEHTLEEASLELKPYTINVTKNGNINYDLFEIGSLATSAIQPAVLSSTLSAYATTSYVNTAINTAIGAALASSY